jgi:hypothetical protein
MNRLWTTIITLASRHRSNSSRVIATAKITTWKSISSPYYSSGHCISPYENEQIVLHKLSYVSHSREHKILCTTYAYVIEHLVSVLLLRSLLSIKESFIIEQAPLALTLLICIVEAAVSSLKLRTGYPVWHVVEFFFFLLFPSECYGEVVVVYLTIQPHSRFFFMESSQLDNMLSECGELIFKWTM